MAIRTTEASFEERLSNQLQLFSELSESLTLRVLDLEERFNALESSQNFKTSSEMEKTKKLLVDSAERVRHLQVLLQEDQEDRNSLLLMDQKEVIVSNSQSFGEDDSQAYKCEDSGAPEVKSIDETQMPLLSA